ncbi:MAG: RNA polymerase sigma factor [Prevotella sp.]|jgi:RNA polymerase sigma-70 factor (ECF subfamily)|nr:sigma-70 family RNA polymerase sigma factor [Prevotella sp.]
MNIFGTDKEQHIIKLFRRGDASAMDMLYAEYADYLTAVCARYIPDDDELKDVLQESFIKIFSKIGEFNYRGNGSLRAWITRIVINESLLTIRKKKNSPIINIENEPPDIQDDEPELGNIGEEVLTNMIRQLPDGYRTVFNLFVIEGKSHKEIAKILNIKADSSASQFHKAKKQLAKMIKNYRLNKELNEGSMD